MTEYKIPQQPDVSVVWDALGKEWTYENHDGWLWENTLTGEALDWDDLVIGYGPVTDYPPESDPWEDVKPGRLYWVTGHSKFWTGKVRGLGMKYGKHECLRGDGWLLMRNDEHDRLQSAVELTAIPTHLLDALIETAVDYDDPEDGTAVSREALHDLTDWLADHPQNKGDGHA